MPVKHRKTSTVPNALNDTRRIGGDDWNNEHDVDLGVSDITGLEERLIPTDQVVQYRDDALAYRNQASGFADDAAESASEAAGVVNSLAADDGTTKMRGTWFGGAVAWLSDLATSTGTSLLGYTLGVLGARARTLLARLRDGVSLGDFGFIGDGTIHPLSERYATLADAQVDYPFASALTDNIDWAAIQSAVNYCETAKKYLQGVAGTVLLNKQLRVKCSGDLSMLLMNVNGSSATGEMLIVGETTGTLITLGLDLKLPEFVNLDKTGGNWAGAGSYPAVAIAQVYRSVIQVGNISGFGVAGLDVGGWTYGNGLNRFTFKGGCTNNLVNVRLRPRSSAAWVNDNLFENCTARIDTANAGVTGTRNIQIIPFDITAASDSWPNNNRFTKPCIEGNAPEYHLEIAGSDNFIGSPRMEVSSGTPRVLFTGHASVSKTTRNVVEDGWNPLSVIYSTSGVVVACGPRSISHNVLESADTRPILALRSLSGNAFSHAMGFPTSVSPLNSLNTSTGWVYNVTATNASFKGTADAFAKVVIGYNGSSITFGDGTAAGTKFIHGANSGLRVASDLLPNADNTYTFGTTSLRWTTIYAATGTINTSDARSKQDVTTVDDAALDAWADVQYVQYRWKDSVATKGAAARIHTGVLAQSIHKAFEDHGLDAFKYGLLCYDEWAENTEAVFNDEGESTGERRVVVAAGNAWGIRADQCLFMEAALMRRELKMLKSK